MARPVFIIGSPRSGTSILTWCLGQHPNLYPLEETIWLGPLGVAVGRAFEQGSSRAERSQISAMGIGRDRFFRGFGMAIDHLILEHRSRPAGPVAEETPIATVRRLDDPKRRWVDGTPENALYVRELLALFSAARFIHLLRDPEEVVRSLGNFDRIGGEAMSPDDASREWLRHVRPCLAAERDLPVGTVLRVAHRELEQRAEAALARCLAFVGESWNDNCLKPLAQRINSSAPSGPREPLEVDAELLAELCATCAEAGLETPRAMVARR